jgi:hypothetical protein
MNAAPPKQKSRNPQERALDQARALGHPIPRFIHGNRLYAQCPLCSAMITREGGAFVGDALNKTCVELRRWFAY